MFALLLSFLLSACTESPDQLVFNGLSMGTSYQVKVVPNRVAVPEDMAAQIQQTLDSMENIFTTYRPDSELMHLNRAGVKQTVPISAEMLQVLQLSQEVYRLTGGAFDPTVGSLVNLWGFGPDPSLDRVPAKNQINSMLAQVGLNKLELDAGARSARRNADIQLDLSAVAKGFAVDAVAAHLESLGFSNYLVEVGGELRVMGVKANQQPWRIAVESPSLERREVQQALTPGNAGVATSGDYRNYFEKDGSRYSHTIDPRTGYPVSHRLASVTVIAGKTAFADALATGLMVMGHEAALQLAEKNDLAIYLLVKEGDGFKAYASPAFAHYLPGE
ncbi:FAD:protein FMN transferase [Porticoccus sp.]